jgi:glycosyltransferase involved in cell wall biosynthesis
LVNKQKTIKSKNILKNTRDKTTKKSITISVCMIVKDEEQFLDNCLKSVKDIADEIIIIDTGSKDKTVDIAKKYTDKIFFHPWQDSFSEARNHYFEYATGYWIFQIDADEELVKEDIPILMKAVKNPDIDAIMVQIISSLKEGKNEGRHNVERIFRNNGVIHYEGRVHNRLVGFERPEIYQIRFKHHGYNLNNQELSEKKHHRRMTLLKKDIEENPKNPLPYHYLSCCYIGKSLFDETLDTGLKAIELSVIAEDNNPIFLWTRYNVAMVYYKLKQFDQAETLCLSAIAINNMHIDSYYILTLIYYDQGDWDNVIKHGKRHVDLSNQLKTNPQNFGTMVINTHKEAWNTYLLLGIAYHEIGKSKPSYDSIQSAISFAPDPFYPLRAAGIYFFHKGLLSKSEKYFQRALLINSNDQNVKDILEKIRLKKQKMSVKQTVSCCMIVKNEEEFLEKCLSSIKDYVDELIIVDTGSTDSTVDIAKKFTDKIYFHPWENSFSKARNQVLQYATSDWVFQIDGDEELMEGSGERIREAVQNAEDADIIYVNIFCSYANGTKKSLHNFERLFRNNGKIHYEGSVHNQIVGGTKSFYSSIALWHYGYDVDEEKSLQKFKRTTNLLKKEIENDPNNPKFHHYLSASYFSKGMNEDALDETIKAIQLSDNQNNNHSLYAWSHFIASMASFRLRDIDQAEKYALKSLNKYPEHLDSFYMLTIISAEKEDWKYVLKYGDSFISILEKYKDNSGNSSLTINNTMNEGPAVFLLMGHAAYNTTDFIRMEEYYNRAYDIAESKWEILWNIGVYHMDKSGEMDKAGHFLELAANEAPYEYNAWYMLAKYYNKKEFIDEEINALEKVIEIGTKEDFIINRLFSLYVKKDLNDRALTLLKSIKNPDISFYSTLLNLGNLNVEKEDIESALLCYMKAAEMKPDSHEAWSILGELTFLLGRIDDSIVFFEKALKVKDSDLNNLIMICYLKLKTSDIESHIKYCDKLLSLLDLNRNRVINNFNDLKYIFIEMGSSPDIGSGNLPRIDEIINELEGYISHAA